MTRAEAFRLLQALQFTVQKLRSNIGEAIRFGDLPSNVERVLPDLYPRIYTQQPSDNAVIILDRVISKGEENLEPIDVYNMLFLLRESLWTLNMWLRMFGARWNGRQDTPPLPESFPEPDVRWMLGFDDAA